MTAGGDANPPRTERAALCIVGAGIAGLNALFVASRYLSRRERVILVDRNPRSGGMWNATYDYVRLHQPHPFFTAGNIPWTLGRGPDYLATKGEVLAHFEHCLDVLRREVRLDELYGYEHESHEELQEKDGVKVRVSCRPVSPDDAPVVVEASRLVKAFGSRIDPMPPLELSSDNVVSVSPDLHDLFGEDMCASDAPVYIVGGGKTGMDTAHALVTRFPEREVSLVAGSGMVFFTRDKLFPAGPRRWWGGVSPLLAIADTARRFDGTNESEAHDYLRSTYGTSLNPQCGHFMFGNLSRAENETIASGTNEVLMERVEDVVDREGRTEMVFRSGRTKTIPRGSWIVNCTGYLLKGDHPYEPYASESGAVVSIQPRSMPLVLSSFAAYFLVHLLYLDKIAQTPLYELDAEALRRRSKQVVPYAAMALNIHNMGHLVETVPRRVMDECGLDFDRWYPLPRRLLSFVRFARHRRWHMEHNRRTLDTIRERFQVRCGPLGAQST